MYPEINRFLLYVEPGQGQCERLRDVDFPVTNRTVQRDLLELSAVFPLAVDDRVKPFGWSWQRDASSFDLPGLSIPEALTLKLVEQHLCHQLPPGALDALQPHFRSAAKILSMADGVATSTTWLNKVRTLTPLQPLHPPVIKEDCQRTVYLALMRDLQLRLHYKKRNGAEGVVYESVHPLAIDPASVSRTAGYAAFSMFSTSIGVR